MGWKGTVRSLQASARRSERNAHRRQRDLERQSKEYARMEALEQAAHEVDVYENYLEVLLSMHKECGEEVNWRRMRSKPEPTAPQLSDLLEKASFEKYARYSPNFWGRLLKLETRQRAALMSKVEAAKVMDSDRSLAEFREWEINHSEWAQEKDLAERILNGDRQAKLDAIEALEPFAEIAHLGSAIQLVVHESGTVECRLSVHGASVIPKEIKSLLKSGKLSTKAMPVGRFNDLHQDYVCSCALRVGLELLAILPDEIVIVTANDKVLNGSTGHLEELPILSVAFSRLTLGSLNLEAIDPSDAMKNFVHNMSFKKGGGFMPVDAVDPARFALLT